MENEIFNYILINGLGLFLAESPGQKAPKIIGNANGHQWISWNKPLPEDIDSVQYKYENGELKAV